MASIIYEDFDGIGYSVPGWIESVDTGTVDEDADSTDVGDPDSWEAQCLKIVSVEAESNFTYQSHGAETYVLNELSFIVTDLSALENTNDRIEIAIGFDSTGASTLWNLRLLRGSDGNNYIALLTYPDGSTGTLLYGRRVEEDTLYNVKVLWDSTDDICRWAINDIEERWVALTTGHLEQAIFLLGSAATSLNHDGEFYVGPVSLDDSKAFTANLRWHESFESSEYDYPAWAEVVGTGGTIDGDQATSGVTGAPSWWGDTCLKIVVGDGTGATYAYKGPDTAEPIIYWHFPVIFSAEDFADDESNIFCSFYPLDLAGPVVSMIVAQTDVSTIAVLVAVDHDGGGVDYFVSNVEYQLDTVYQFEVKWDATNNAWAWRVDGVDQANNVDDSYPITSEGALSGTHEDDISVIVPGTTNPANPGYTMFVGDIKVKTDDWVGVYASHAASVQALTLTQHAATVSVSTIITPSIQTLNLTLHSATVSATQNETIAAGLQTLNLTLHSATVSATQNETIAAGLQTLNLTLHSATVSATQNETIAAGLQTLNLTLHSATVSATQNETIAAGLQTLNLTLHSATVSTGQNINIGASLFNLTLTQHAPTISATQNRDIEAALQNLNLTLHSATVSTGQNIVIAAALQELSLSILNSSVALSPTIEAALQTLNLNILAPSIKLDPTIEAALQTLNLALHSATVSTSTGVVVAAALQELSLSLLASSIVVSSVHSGNLLTLNLTQHAATVSTASDVTVAANLLTLLTSLHSPQINYDYTLGANQLNLSLTIHSSGISLSPQVEAALQTLNLSVLPSTIAVGVAVPVNLQTLNLTIHSPQINYDHLYTAGVQTLNLSLLAPLVYAAVAKGKVTATIEFLAPNITAEFKKPDTDIKFKYPDVNVKLTN